MRAHPEYNLKAAPHYLSANSGPFFLQESLLHSPYHTDTISNASVIYVDDYCYRMWWISAQHSEVDVTAIGDTLLQAWAHLKRSVLFQVAPLDLLLDLLLEHLSHLALLSDHFLCP